MNTDYIRANTDWFYDCKWGVMCHWLAAPPSSRNLPPMTAEDWNRRVDGFDVEGLAGQLASAQVPYFLFTLGQCTGYFCSPNETCDTLMPNRPSRLSKRDLAADLYRGLPVRMDAHWDKPDKPATYWQKPHGRFIGGAQAHFLTFPGPFWGGGHEPRFPEAMTLGYTRHVHQSGGVLTWDVPIGHDGAENGLIPEPFLRQLHALGRAMR